jgi:peptidoglycan/LPS O-acetylase OafA/YrhL
MPALDGLRAVAVAAVVLFHFWPDAFGGGFVGVDVFFVLSGFLITGMILAEVERTDGLDLRAFWGRRIRRLVPAVVVLVAVTAVAVWVTRTGSARGLLDSVGALTWTTNWLELGFRSAPWFEADTNTVLDHLWSLAIEEQFYLVWPPVLWWLWRRGLTRRSIVGAIVVLSTVSAALMWWAGPSQGYLRTDARAFELLGGAALAASGFRPGRRTSAVLVTAGLVTLAVYVPLGDPQAAGLYPWGFLGLTAAFVALVAGAIDPPRLVTAALTQPVVRHLGQVSYGIYLWHIPVLRIMSEGRMGISGPGLHLARFAVLAALVEGSHRFVERPILQGRMTFRWPRVAWGYAAAAVALLAYWPGVRSSWDHQWDTAAELPDIERGQERVLVTGDLLGVMSGAGLAREDDLAVFEVGDVDCYFVEYGVVIDGPKTLTDTRYCREWDRRWRHAAEELDPDVAVLATGYWDTLARESGGATVAPDADPVVARFEVVANRQVEALAALAPRAVVVLVTDMVGLAPPGQRDPAERRQALAIFNDALRRAAVTHDNVSIVELGPVDGAAGLARRARVEVGDAIRAGGD